VDLGEVRRLPKGKIIEFPSAKVPRLIGKKSSMIGLLKDYTGGDIMVGNNGYVWMSEKSDMPLLLKAIAMIERKAHKSGLTDEIAGFLRSQVGDRPRREMQDGEGQGPEGAEGGFEEPGGEPGNAGDEPESGAPGEEEGGQYGQQ
jgi:exosome complex component RRP4